MIHGISEEDVKDAPEFNAVFAQLKPMLEDAIVVAHNAAFDMSALRHVLDLYGISYPETQYACTYKLAMKTWAGLENYKLKTVCKFLNHVFIHHNAEEDAKACGQVLLAATLKNGLSSFNEIESSIGMKLGKLFIGGYSPCSVRAAKNSGIDLKGILAETNEFNPEHEFFQKKLVFTGTLSSMSRKEAMQKVVNTGGFIGDGITKDTDFLVMGMQDYFKFADGKESSKTKKAKSLIASGKNLQIIDEAEFLRFLQG
ncbi:exonuclease domain-containing protein [Heliobacterium chlorum]|uniref:exonuclease domain-containing protein n=1 Tax=Heliobacterium chlorum TaxID=2698 RepID=UPI001FAD32D1|nr:exonuclease domain-containing protein [Heliobacterium chlorum]